jgi:hypothetical protein
MTDPLSERHVLDMSQESRAFVHRGAKAALAFCTTHQRYELTPIALSYLLEVGGVVTITEPPIAYEVPRGTRGLT